MCPCSKKGSVRLRQRQTDRQRDRKKEERKKETDARHDAMTLAVAEMLNRNKPNLMLDMHKSFLVAPNMAQQSRHFVANPTAELRLFGVVRA